MSTEANQLSNEPDDRQTGASWRRRAARWCDVRFAYIALAPTVLTLILLTVFPTFFLSYIAFHNVNITDVGTFTFVGFDNFRRLVHDGDFWNALRNTLVYSGSAVAIELVLGLGLALLLQGAMRGAGVVRTFLLIPMMLPPIAVAISWKLMFQPEFGVINDILYRLGIEDLLNRLGIVSGPILWASGEATAMASL